MKKIALVVLGLCSALVQAEALVAPVGVRPCCAFGVDLKAQLGSMPVPFFSLENVLGAEDIGSHQYNDGSESVAGSLFGFAEEANGVIYTQLGGFIDTAHVRDTADYTYYLYQLNRQHLGQEAELDLPAELRIRRIVWTMQARPLSAQQLTEYSAKAAALTAFRLAQWHEIAQWFGMVSVSGFKEYASAFSSEDLYSNMLGALLAQAILIEQPHLNQREFERMMDLRFQQALDALQVQTKQVARENIEQLDGIWWDSSRRLPDKWVVLFRDYNLALNLAPHTSEGSTALSLEQYFDDQQAIEDWVSLELHAAKQEKSFAALPLSLKRLSVWRTDQFQALADFAHAIDEQTKPKR